MFDIFIAEVTTAKLFPTLLLLPPPTEPLLAFQIVALLCLPLNVPCYLNIVVASAAVVSTQVVLDLHARTIFPTN